MSANTEKAKELLKKANDELTALCRVIAAEQPIDRDAHSIYSATAELNVLTSQLIDKDNPRVCEGNITVNNIQAMVSIQDIEIRDNIEFEIFHNGEWLKGHRSNSQYGQCFYPAGVILHKEIKGRISLPLKMN